MAKKLFIFQCRCKEAKIAGHKWMGDRYAGRIIDCPVHEDVLKSYVAKRTVKLWRWRIGWL